MIWIGIDPGKDTGIVVRDGTRLVWHTVIEGDTPQGCEVLTDDTIRRVLQAVDQAFDAAIEQQAHLPIQNRLVSFSMEGLTKPRGRRAGKVEFINPLDLAAPAMVIGAVRALFTRTVMVPPGGHGSGPLSTYPAALVTDAERRHGLNRTGGRSATIRHARSAWDVAGAAPVVRRIELARVSAR